MKDGKPLGGLVTLFSAKGKPNIVPQSKYAPPKGIQNREDWIWFKEEPLEYWYLYLFAFAVILALLCLLIFCCGCYGPEVDGLEPKAKEEKKQEKMEEQKEEMMMEENKMEEPKAEEMMMA